MKILVGIKQVPRLDQVRFQQGVNRIVREGVESYLNPLDLAALGTGLALRQQHGGELVAVTMGPPSARAAAEQALRLGADRAVHLNDPRFAGSDTLATARALSRLQSVESADLLLFGRSTLDGGTAQTPPQVAELAGLAYLAGVSELALLGGSACGLIRSASGTERHCVTLPAVVSVLHGPLAVESNDCRARTVEEWDADRLGGDEAGYGIRGSATYVAQVVDAVPQREGQRASAVEAVRMLDRSARSARTAATEDQPRPAGSQNVEELWTVVEHDDDCIDTASIEALACASRVADQLQAVVTAVLLFAPPGAQAAELAARGADRVLRVSSEEFRDYDPDIYTAALSELVAKRRPLAVIAPWTGHGRDYLARVAARLNLGLTGDFVGLDVTGRPNRPDLKDLVWLKPAWAGTALARVVSRTAPALGTLRPGAVRPLSVRDGSWVPVEDIDLVEPLSSVRRLRRTPVEGRPVACPAMDRSDVLFCVGRGVPRQTVKLLEDVAAEQGWMVGGTPLAVQAGTVPAERELSLQRCSLAPPVFVALEVEDRYDLACARAAGVVVTVDPDPCAPSHGESDVVVVGEAAEFVAAAHRELGRHPAAAPS